jgi:ABC-2 type transport system ATP-binding protein
MRDLVRGFADEGGTVFLSSHLLNEIERVADDIVVIGRGQIVAHGTKAELVGGSGTFVRAVDESLLVPALRSQGLQADQATGGGVHVDAACATIGSLAARHAIVLTELRAAGSGLEELFLELTAADAREVVAA